MDDENKVNKKVLHFLYFIGYIVVMLINKHYVRRFILTGCTTASSIPSNTFGNAFLSLL